MSGHRRGSVPVLTDVLQLHHDEAFGPSTPMQEAAIASPEQRAGALDAAPASIGGDDPALVARILENVQRQIDLRIENQLHAALAPAIEQLTTALLDDARRAMATSLRDVIQRAVTQEIERVRNQS